ncbi:hypothetical protein ACFRNT_14100 [Streptomyces sp. NPDC056697]|uniref:hypothetical protein n=1 Tax=Streptomyces sp. NPDC056697 TaxID=3345915 RepID=UPI0036CF6B08
MPVQTMPRPAHVAEGAIQIHSLITGDPEFDAFRAASLEYSDDWQCFTGFPVVSNWSLEDDAAPLFEEGLRALSLKAAVYALTSDDQAAEISIAVPVDEMTHAMLAQAQLLHRIAERHGVTIIHQTDQEHTDYMSTGYTADCYRAAWGQPPARYWLDATEVAQRRQHLAGLYASIGMGRSGREHSIKFEELAAA